MEFLKPKGTGGAAKLKQQLLTVGDAAGNLHVYDVPQNLWRPLANERAIMSLFLEREIKVVVLHQPRRLRQARDGRSRVSTLSRLCIAHSNLHDPNPNSAKVPGRPPVPRLNSLKVGGM